MNKKIVFTLLFALTIFTSVNAQQEREEEEKPRGFRKENLFTGGSINLSFFNNQFIIGGSPVFGYSVTNWADAGIIVNYNYASQRDVSGINANDKLRQYTYGGGGFLRLYPTRFLFVQAQVEHNFIKEKYIRPVDGYTETSKTDAGSVLVGGGYCTGRQGRGGQPFFYLSVMFDVSGNLLSPYTDQLGRAIPLIRGGVQIPLFQGWGKGNR